MTSIVIKIFRKMSMYSNILYLHKSMGSMCFKKRADKNRSIFRHMLEKILNFNREKKSYMHKTK